MLFELCSVIKKRLIEGRKLKEIYLFLAFTRLKSIITVNEVLHMMDSAEYRSNKSNIFTHLWLIKLCYLPHEQKYVSTKAGPYSVVILCDISGLVISISCEDLKMEEALRITQTRKMLNILHLLAKAAPVTQILEEGFYPLTL